MLEKQGLSFSGLSINYITKSLSGKGVTKDNAVKNVGKMCYRVGRQQIDKIYTWI